MKLFEKYSILQELGGQSKRKFGSVFLLQSKTNSEKFILKVLQKDSKNEHLQMRLKNEASFAFDLDGLPKVIDFYESDQEIGLLLHYKNGVTLDQFWSTIKRKNRLDFIKELTEKLAPIFEELKQKSIVHCDIKPSNILIEKLEGNFSVHLLDFGLAIRLTDPCENKLIFPLGYAAPELILNRKNCITHATDIFSLGIVFWRLYEGKLPLLHQNPSVFTNLQITHPLPESREMGKDLFQIIKKMSYKHSFSKAPNQMQIEDVDIQLQKAINERYSSLLEVENDLKKLAPKKYWFNRILS